jgi:imidazolonepropionase-like amidohydrolase
VVRVLRSGTTLLLAVVAVVVATPAAPQPRALAITRVTVVNVVTGQLQPNSTVVVRGGIVAAITPGAPPPSGATVVDGRGKFLIPGLWDMHAHTEATGEAWLQLYVANGVTGIRDMGSDLELVLTMREATSSGRVLGPRIFAAGPILDDAPGDWPFRMRVKTPEAGRAAVQLLKRRGVDLIKVHDNTPRDVFIAIADEARLLKLPVAGHVPRGLTIEQVVEAGQRDIEHLSNLGLWRPCSGGGAYRPESCRAFFAMLAARGVWQTPTLAAMAEVMTIGTPASAVSTDHMAYAGPSVRAMWAGNQGAFGTPDVVRALRAGAETGATVTRDLDLAGVGILTGCDSMIAGFCVHDELEALVHGGMTPLAALRASTLNPARYFGLEQTMGSIAPGKTADLVLLDANPLTAIENVRLIRAVVVAGRLLDQAELDKVLVQAKASATLP